MGTLKLVRRGVRAALLGSVLAGVSGPALAVSVSIDWNMVFSRSAGGNDEVLAAFDSAGNIKVLVEDERGDRLQLRTYDGTGALIGLFSFRHPVFEGKIFDATEDGSGNLYIVGKGGQPDDDVVIAKYDSMGNNLWTQTYDYIAGNEDAGYAIARDGFGDVYVAGETGSGGPPRQALLVKYSSSGVFQWVRTVSFGSDTRAFGVAASGVGDVFMVGAAQIGPSNRPFVSKHNSSGTLQFSRTYSAFGTPSEAVDAELSGSNLIIAFNGNMGSYVLGAAQVATSDGSLGFYNYFMSPDQMQAHGLAVAGNGNIFVAGTRRVSGVNDDLIFMGFDGTLGLLTGWPLMTGTSKDDGMSTDGSARVRPVRVVADGSAVALLGTVDTSSAPCSQANDIFIERVTAGGPPSTFFSMTVDLPPAIEVSGVATDTAGNAYAAARIGDDTTGVVVKFDAASGSVLWNREFTDANHACAMEASGGIVTIGDAIYVAFEGFNSSMSDNDAVVVRYDVNGNVIGTPATINFQPDISLGALTTDGTYLYLAAQYDTTPAIKDDDNMLLVKLDQSLTVVDSTTHNFAGEDDPRAIAVDGFGGLYVLAPYPYTFTSWPVPDNAYGLLKFSTSPLAFQWSRTYMGGQPQSYPTGLAVNGNDVFLVGADLDSFFNLTQVDARLMKIDGVMGDRVWSQSYPGSPHSAFLGITVDSGGNLLINGIVGTVNATHDALSVSYDSNGTLRWADTYDSGGPLDEGQAIAVGSIYSAGISDASIRVIKYSEVAAVGSANIVASISSSPNPTVVNNFFNIVLTVTNNGTGTANNVAPALSFTGGTGAVTFVSGPTPSGGITLTPGASQSFTWTYNPTSSGSAVFSGSASATDAGTAGTISSGAVGVTETINTVNVTVTSAPSVVALGSSFTVNWTILGGTAVSHNNIHWGDTSEAAGGPAFAFFTADQPGLPGSYSQTLTMTASRTGVFFFRVHVTVDGADYNSSEGAIIVGSIPGGVDVAVEETATPSLTYGTGGDANWFSQSVESIAGGSAAQTGPIFNSQSTYLATVVNGPGTLAFSWKVDSEQNFDFLALEIDGVVQQQISGSVDWTQVNVTVPAGSHTVRWVYSKDGSVSAGADAGWLDSVGFTPGSTGGGTGVVASGLAALDPGHESFLEEGGIRAAPNLITWPSLTFPPIRFVLRGDPNTDVELRIYNEAGVFVRTLTGSTGSDGYAEIAYDGLDGRGVPLGTGVYWAASYVGGVSDRQPFAVVKDNGQE